MRCRGLHRLANPAYISQFLFPGLLHIAPYCVPGGVRVVSEVSGSHITDSFTLDPRVAMGTGCSQLGEFTPDGFLHLHSTWQCPTVQPMAD
jgi:hypothetical protein